jgi:hypothetical protein
MNHNRQRAADLITQHFKVLEDVEPNTTVLVDARHTGKMMVEIYRLLTNEMPQSPGIDIEYFGNETPAVEWASPTERDPGEVYYVHPGNPDILIKGDHHGEESRIQKSITGHHSDEDDDE